MRTRLTERTASSELIDDQGNDYGLSKNTYWMDKIKQAVTDAVGEVETRLVATIDEKIATVSENKESSKMAMVFTPKVASEEEPKEEIELSEEDELVVAPKTASVKTAGAAVVPESIGQQKWQEMQNSFPEYTKQEQLRMLDVAPTTYNKEAVASVTKVLGDVAANLEENGFVKEAGKLDAVASMLDFSIDV